MPRLRAITLGLTLLATGVLAQGPQPVRVWEGTLSLPSYEEGPPDPNPPLDAFTTPGRPNYPYTIRDQLTDRRLTKSWRALFLENEYLKCSVLPDLGGHLYSCTDKVNGAEMFYANSSIKLSNIAYRGSWAAFGIEFNFPVSHNWMTTSPVDFAWAQQGDGSGSVWVGNIDRVYGMQWRVQLTLRPGRAVLEQHTTLYNRSDVRRRFYWWTNAGVRVWDDSRILYPQTYTASHGFTFIDTWPIDQQGTDHSILRNQVFGPVSRFSYGSREPFMAVYHPRTDAGVVHYSSPTDLPAKKFWSWGVDADAMDWRRALSDDSSAYVEIQAGLFRDQETYGFMEPHDRVAFSEYWLPVRGIGGVTRATPDVALHMTRAPRGTGEALRVRMNVTRRMPRAALELRAGAVLLVRDTLSLDPGSALDREWPVPARTPVTVVVRDGDRTVLEHTENHFDLVPDSLVKVGPQVARQLPPPASRSASDWLEDGETREVNGDYLGALAAYREAHRADATSRGVLRSLGRLAVALRRYDEANDVLTRAVEQSPADHELAYYLALARLELGDTLRARSLLELAQQYGPRRAAATLVLANIDGQHGAFAASWARLRAALEHTPYAERLWFAAAVAGDVADAHEASALRARASAMDPTSSLLRYENARKGNPDGGLFRHLAGDPERILTIATEYMRLGRYDLARDVLSRDFPADGVVSERGVPHPREYPLIAYYRGYVKERLGDNGDADYAAAATMTATYVFPNRPEDVSVLTRVIARRGDEPLARHLLGMMSMQSGDTAAAIALWERARASRPSLPSLLRNLGYAYLLAGRRDDARRAFEDGVRFDSLNAGVYFGLDSTLRLGGASAAERAGALGRFPRPADMPTAMVYRLALLLAHSGDHTAAELQLRRPFFARVEGGTNVRAVWLEVRIARAESHAQAGECRQALAIVAGLARPAPGYPFTRDGLAPFLAKGPLADRVTQLRTRCAQKGR